GNSVGDVLPVGEIFGVGGAVMAFHVAVEIDDGVAVDGDGGGTFGEAAREGAGDVGKGAGDFVAAREAQELPRWVELFIFDDEIELVVGLENSGVDNVESAVEEDFRRGE